MPCCGKKKKVSKLPPGYAAQTEYKNSVIKDFMASRKQMLEKQSKV
jgi:hypothetical protein